MLKKLWAVTLIVAVIGLVFGLFWISGFPWPSDPKWTYIAPWRSLCGHRGAISNLAFSPDSKTLASSSYDDTIKLWDMTALEERFALVGHHGRVTAVVFSPDGQRLYSGCADGTVQVWDVLNGHELMSLNLAKGAIEEIILSRDGKLLLVARYEHQASGIYRVGDNGTLSHIRDYDGRYDFFAFAGSTRIAAAQWVDRKAAGGPVHEGLIITLLDAKTGQTESVLRVPSSQGEIACSPDGKWIALGGGYRETVQIWDLGDRKKILSLIGDVSGVFKIAFLDMDWVIAAGVLGTHDPRCISVWHLTGDQRRLTLGTNANSAGVTSMAISPNHKLLAAGGGADCTIYVWELSKILTGR